MNIKKHITVINGKKKSPHNEGIIVYVCECNRHLHFTKTFVEEKLEELKNTLPNMSDYVKKDISVELNNCRLKSLENYTKALENLIDSLRIRTTLLEKGKK